MSDLSRVGYGQRRAWLGLALVTIVLIATHMAVELALEPDLNPLILAVDGATGFILLAIFALYLRRLARERRREVIERMLLDLLSTPRNIQDTASQSLVALRDHGIGRAALIAIIGDGDEPFRPLAASGYPRGWIETAPASDAQALPTAPLLNHSKIPHPWIEDAAPSTGRRPWVAEIPLVSGDTVLGVLMIADRKRGVLQDRAILSLLSTRLGAAFDHAALYEAAYAREQNLEDLEARRREFMAAIAHEIRTPLTSIQAFTDLLRMGQDQMDETAGILVESLGQGVQRLNSLVNDLIDLGRTGETGYALEPQDVDIGAIIRSAESTLRPALMLQEHAVTLDLPETGPIAHADPRVLEQVTLNLLSNASRHSPRGGAITISATRLDTKTVRLTMTDDGPGIPEAERLHIFQPYYRINDRSGNTVPGSGLGLAIARRLLDESGGRIWVESGPEGGARFCVEVRAGANSTRNGSPTSRTASRDNAS